MSAAMIVLVLGVPVVGLLVVERLVVGINTWRRRARRAKRRAART